MWFKISAFRLIAFALAAACAFVGCSAEKDTFVSRNYHSFVSLFNGYYHANKIYKEGVTKVDREVEVPEDGFLPLLPETGGGSAAQFDRAVQKCDVIIFRHKNGRWVDDSYFLKGKCSFYKGNYYDALMAFEYVLGRYSESDLRSEIQLWMARTHFLLNNKFRTQQLLQDAASSGDLSKKLRVELAALQSTVQIRAEKYDEAIATLEGALPLVTGKLEKAKWNFLLAQLYQRQQNFEKAKQHYVATSRLNAHNELNFRSKLNIAQLYIDNAKLTKTEVAEITKPLDKLLRDAKYEEYQDLVYYRLAQIEHKYKNSDKALEHYKKSIEKNGGRQGLLALSNYEVGKIYFNEKRNLDSAQKYFDAAAGSVPDKYAEAYKIKAIATTLRQYKKNKETIHLEDSLLAMSKMPEDELKKRIKEIVEKEEKDKEERKRKEEMEAQRQQSMMQQEQFNQTQQNQNLVNSSGGFYFDNPTQVTQGKASFQRIWGIRKLEDNWRRRNKQANAFASDDEDANVVADDPNDTLNGVEARKKRYFKRVPRSDEDIKASEGRLLTAMYDLAQLFANKLDQPDSAMATYKRVVTRFPDSDLVPKSHYAIYTLATDRNDVRTADHHKNIILTKFPNSLYAKLLRKEVDDAGSEATGNDFRTGYRTLYGLYAAGDYETVLSFSDFLIETHLENDEIGKVYYMKGLSFGHLHKTDSLIQVFEFMKKSFPDEEATKVAVETLKLLSQKKEQGAAGSGKGGKAGAVATAVGGKGGAGGIAGMGGNSPTDSAPPKSQDPNSPFRDFKPLNEKDPVIVLFFIDPNRMKKDDLQVKIVDFNKENYASSRLTLQVYQYKDKAGASWHMAYVSSFDAPTAASVYIKALLDQSPEVKAAFTDEATQAVFISSSNFRTAFAQKRFDDYGKYFIANRDQMLGK